MKNLNSEIRTRIEEVDGVMTFYVNDLPYNVTNTDGSGKLQLLQPAAVTLVEDGMTKTERCSRCGKVLRSSMYGEWHVSGVVSNYCQHCGANLQKVTK